MSNTRVNFIRQQGFEDASARTCDFQYPALMFQPRVIGVIVLAGVLVQAPTLFLTLSAVLYLSALVPRLNPFEWMSPRRFAQGMAATFMLLIGVSLLAGWDVLAWALEALLLAAIGALIFGGFCLGSYVFHVLTGNGEFARRTLPWSRGA